MTRMNRTTTMPDTDTDVYAVLPTGSARDEGGA
jgi:hypothetical protein